MIVLGLVAIDNAIAMAEYDIASSSEPGKQFPSFAKVMFLYLTNRDGEYNEEFLQGLTDAVQNLTRKSQSMHMGSAMFQGPLRIDLILLYVQSCKDKGDYYSKYLTSANSHGLLDTPSVVSWTTWSMKLQTGKQLAWQ
jgi:hypothetical protein